MSKPENSFITGVHKYLPPVDELHREKMNNPYRGGTADVWYSGPARDLWIEYKFFPKLPAYPHTLIKPDYSPLQLDWLRGRYEDGRNVWTIVGSPRGGVIYEDLEWETPITLEAYQQRLLSRAELAASIEAFLRGK